jgi:cytochrome c553
MRNVLLSLVLFSALAACSQKQESPPAPAAGDVTAGKAVAERACKACHGLDGRGIAPGIPNLAAQRPRYLLASLKEYKDGRRSHAALKEMIGNLSDADVRNVVAYYAARPPVTNPKVAEQEHTSLLEEGKKLAQVCSKCHGEDGNSTTPGTPSLAGQQPHYFVVAIEEYHHGERGTVSMESMLSSSSRSDLEKLALYFASQTPAQRAAPSVGDAAAGEPLSAVCGGCHGARGVSADSSTPSLAGQDEQYLMKAIRSYRTTRQHWGMQRFVAGLSDKDIENIAAFYTSQKPRAAGVVLASTKDLAEKCNRCHDVDDGNAAAVAPKIRGQDQDYLIMAMRAYRDGKRASSTMHTMSYVYSNAVIESVASYYASQPAK